MKILIADDHELFLKGLEFILHTHFPDSEIVALKNYTQVLECLEKTRDFNLILTDLAMPGDNWHDALLKIHALINNVPIVIISAVFDKKIVQTTLELGVSGYIPKSSSNSLILSAIDLVLAGGVYIPQEMLVGSFENKELNQEIENLKNVGSEDKTSQTKDLTPRQIEVLKAISRGLSNKQVAYELGLTEGTVKVHVTIILKTLGVNNRMMAVKQALKKGYLTTEDTQL